ncbi:MAG: hypothetical protein EAZ95_16905 [Bacteroidetes bacterium]|nr:MAG: hypothetical protein EAZ95_16905 [Bacteroidota bacterium]
MYIEATLFAMTGENLKYLLAILNSKVGEWYFNQISTTSGMGTNRWKKYKIEQLPIKQASEAVRRQVEGLVEYVLWLHNPENPQASPYMDNAGVARFVEQVLDMVVFELYFPEEMREKEIDVLQFVTKTNFPDIVGKAVGEQASIIYACLKWLLEPDNPIRNRDILKDIVSEIMIKIVSNTY